MKLRTLFIYLPLLFFACTKKDLPFPPIKKTLILTSVEPYTFLTNEIASGLVDVRCVLPSSIDPHGWEPKYQDIAPFQNAVLWFTIGEPYENLLSTKIREINPQFKTVSLIPAVKHPLNVSSNSHHHSPESSLDTHFWLDPLIDVEQASLIKEHLISLLPEKREIFENNFSILKKQLISIDHNLKESLAPYKNDVLITSHNAFTYFCYAYNLRQFVLEPSEGKEPKTKDLTKLIHTIKTFENCTIGVFLEPAHSNKAAHIIAQSFGFKEFTVNPYEKNLLDTWKLLSDILMTYGKKCSNSIE